MTIEEYILNHIDEEPAYLAAINRNTWVRQMNPRMCSGHLQGRVLSMIARMIQPQQILEVGTFTINLSPLANEFFTFPLTSVIIVPLGALLRLTE